MRMARLIPINEMSVRNLDTPEARFVHYVAKPNAARRDSLKAFCALFSIRPANRQFSVYSCMMPTPLKSLPTSISAIHQFVAIYLTCARKPALSELHNSFGSP